MSPTAPPTDAQRRAARSAKLRLGLLVGVLVVAFVVFAGFGVVSKDDVRGVIDPLGPFAPLAYVVVAVALSSALVPGALLAAVAGVLFGPLVGTVVSIVSSVLSSMVQLVIAARTGGRGMQEISGPKLRQVEEAVARHGLLAVAGQRLMPGVPDAPLSYTFGLLGVKLRDIALGTALGSLPRAFAYAVLGSSLDDLTSPLAYVALAVWIAAGAAGLELARRAVQQERRIRRDRAAAKPTTMRQPSPAATDPA